jgi:repressor of nif and glnA expression
MDTNVERKYVAILRILAQTNGPLGARVISRMLEGEGIYLTERAVRFDLQLMDERGLTSITGRKGRGGRNITDKGREELDNALVSDKVGMIASKIDELSYLTTFSLETKSGDVILNVSLIRKDDFPEALDIVKEVCRARLCMSNSVLIAKQGEELGTMVVPKGMVALGTVCAVTVNGKLLRHRIHVNSRFGGILQVADSKPLRFTEIIEYSGSSLDPAEIFIKGKMTSVLEAARTGSGKVLAGFREVPVACLPEAEDILNRLSQVGFCGTVVVGEPNQPTLQIPVSNGYAGMVILAGLNPLAAVEEMGIDTQNISLSMMMDYQKLTPVS